jgi:hypothetical protein
VGHRTFKVCHFAQLCPPLAGQPGSRRA